eukprot:GHVQ01015542.1.p1 GENE.GHVQ01015542.1~~GHVQ01015542.1.p1  ORF type:complete len:307 (+),score=30.89 GHVQ01015542.1:92-1012(+)
MALSSSLSCTSHSLLSSASASTCSNSSSSKPSSDSPGCSEPLFPRHDKMNGHLIDISLPILPQVYNLSPANYAVLSHNSIFLTKHSPQLFPYLWMDLFTKTAWWLVPTIWLPVSASLNVYSHSVFQTCLSMCLFGWILGLMIWSIMEYCFHRFIFHFDESRLPDHGLLVVTHFLLHGIHHLLPMDSLRLVMPPVLISILFCPFWIVTFSVIPHWLCLTGWSGAVSGYVIYDVIHYSTHHTTLLLRYLPYVRDMKIYHMRHHYKDPHRGFGVSSKFWDYVCGTLHTSASHTDGRDGMIKNKSLTEPT